MRALLFIILGLPANQGPCISPSLKSTDNQHLDRLIRTQAVVRALLVAGSKSPSHLSTAFERYSELLRVFTTADANAAVGEEGPARGMGATTLLQQCFDFYAELPQKALMAVDKLLSLGLVSPVAVVSWIMRSQGVRWGLASDLEGRCWRMEGLGCGLSMVWGPVCVEMTHNSR